MKEFFPCSRPDYKATLRVVSQQDRLFLHKKLNNAAVLCPMKWILEPEPQGPVEDPKQSLEPVLIDDLQEEFIRDKDIFVEKCKVSEEQIAWLAEQTTEQRNSQMWGKFWRLRLTGSNFGDVLEAIERHTISHKPYPPSLFKMLNREYCIGIKDSIMWNKCMKILPSTST